MNNSNKDAKKTNILLISKMPISENSAYGNTVCNFFKDWDNTDFTSLYLREEIPNNHLCKSYYNITDKQIIKNLFYPGKIGKYFKQSEIPAIREDKKQIESEETEKTLISFFRARENTIIMLLVELLWGLGIWKNNKLDTFLIGDFDYIFAAAANPIYLQSIIKYCQKKTKAKLVLYFADDTYTYKSYSPLKGIYKFILRRSINSSVKNSSVLYGVTTKLCEEYGNYFNRKILLLNKGCDLTQYQVKETISVPIKIVYAGNLLYNRWKILEVLADELSKLNNSSQKIVMEIYTTAAITPVLDKALNRVNTSTVMGPRPYEEIKKILAGADIALYVESFDDEAVKSTRLSFSTKIIDCMQSGSCMMAIGPAGIASMEYLKNVEGAIVITDLAKIGESCREIVQNPASIPQKAAALRVYAQAHHDIAAVRAGLQKDFAAIAASGKQD